MRRGTAKDWLLVAVVTALACSSLLAGCCGDTSAPAGGAVDDVEIEGGNVSGGEDTEPRATPSTTPTPTPTAPPQTGAAPTPDITSGPADPSNPPPPAAGGGGTAAPAGGAVDDEDTEATATPSATPSATPTPTPSPQTDAPPALEITSCPADPSNPALLVAALYFHCSDGRFDEAQELISADCEIYWPSGVDGWWSEHSGGREVRSVNVYGWSVDSEGWVKCTYTTYFTDGTVADGVAGVDPAGRICQV